MKIVQICCLSLAFVCLIIGIHQSIIYGIAQSYWLFMFSLGFLFAYKLQGPRAEQKDDNPAKITPKKAYTKAEKAKK